MVMKMLFLMVITTLSRHGESEWNQQNRFCGWFDANLSDTGVKVLSSFLLPIISSFLPFFSQYILLHSFILQIPFSFHRSLTQLYPPSSLFSICAPSQKMVFFLSFLLVFFNTLFPMFLFFYHYNYHYHTWYHPLLTTVLCNLVIIFSFFKTYVPNFLLPILVITG